MHSTQGYTAGEIQTVAKIKSKAFMNYLEVDANKSRELYARAKRVVIEFRKEKVDV
jgi:hypothetical protein